MGRFTVNSNTPSSLDRTAHEVLVVDDNSATRYTTSRNLRAAGFRTLEAGSGAEALRLVDAGVSAVVLDVHMPDIDGFEVCGRIRAGPRTALLPVVHLSATYVNDEDKVRGLDAGADAYMTHPVEPALLVATLQALIRARMAEEAMRRTDARFRLATDAAKLGIWTWQPDTDKVSWDNARPFEIFGLRESDDAVDAARFMAEFLHPDDVPLFERATARTLKGEGGFSFECRIRRADGQQRWIRFTGKTVESGARDGTAQIVGTVEDITERKHSEESLREFASQLSEADRRKDEFLATLAHELRNPLAPIRMGLQVIRRADSPETLQKATAMMDRQIKQMVRLVDDLLDVSRISRDKLQLQRSRVALSTVLDQAVETSEAVIGASDHKLIVSAPSEPVVVDADTVRLVQVFTNLISNAAKYSERGSLIWLSSEATDDEIAVSVKDQGIGIPAAMLPQIFDMFVQVDRSLERSQGGLGIGLTLVKRLVELHGGSVEAHSPGEGLGSEFVVRLPRVRTLLADETAPVQGGQSAQGLRVLIADDNEDAAESLVQLLAMMGNTVHRAKDGLQAVEMAEHLRPEVIVLDIGMPGLNGFEACRRIRAQPWNQGVVMIALTGWGQDDDRRRSTDAGFDRHLVKPVDPLMLEKLMSDLR